MLPAATRSALRIRLHRHLLSPSQSLATGFAVITIVGALFLTVTERASFLQLLFEVTSAFATVGLSTGITGSLTVVGK